MECCGLGRGIEDRLSLIQLGVKFLKFDVMDIPLWILHATVVSACRYRPMEEGFSAIW
jgi:hypothetical protein